MRALAARLGIGAALAAATLAAGLLLTRRAVPPTVGADSPALSAALVALGGSRGILAEILWWRIGDLQRQSRYAELVPLTDLLVTLDPSSADAWAYNAWNLAYNVSAAHQDPAERWRWVRKGLDLLTRGLGFAPADPTLLRQIGWFWEDKIGGDNDTAAPHYRAHVRDIPPPEGAEAFAARLGGVADWDDPRLRALFWYDRSGNPFDTLRATVALLSRDPAPAPRVGYFLAAARRAWPSLSHQQAAQIRAFAQTLAARLPAHAGLRDFLKEIAP